MHDRNDVATSRHSDPSLDEFQTRARAHAARHRSKAASQIARSIIHQVVGLPRVLRRLPTRYGFHMLILGIGALAVIIGRIPLYVPAQGDGSQSMTTPWGDTMQRPFTGADTHPSPDRPRHDAPGELHLPGGDALVAMQMRLDENGALVLPAFTASIAVESATIRTGPGTMFDTLATMSQTEAVTIVARAENWLSIQTPSFPSAWIAADVLDIPGDALVSIPQARVIPSPPPPLIAQATSSDLNVRDGPGTDYVRMTRVDAGESVDLLSRSGSWFQVETPDGTQGWIDSTYLTLQPGVIERVPETTDVPPVDPERRGRVTDTGINLRTGPGTKYPSLEKLTADTSLTLLARYDAWYKVQTAGGTTGWVSGDFIAVSAFIQRRVPRTTDIPALPKPAPAAQPAAVRTTAAWVWPTTGRLTSPFGWRVLGGQSNFHNGIDIANQAGTRIVAARSGTVIKAGWCSGYGYCVMLDHGDGFQSEYGHMLSSPPVGVGQSVTAGQLIGYMGSTYDSAGGGYSTGNHLHMTLRQNGTAVNPTGYLP